VISIREVAKRSGVSPSTVSRVLSGSARVDDSTRKRVEDVIRETGYRPNINAQSLRSRSGQLVGLVVPDTHETFATLIHYAEAEAYRMGHALIVGNPQGDPEKERHLIADLLSRNVDAIIFSRVSDASHVADTFRGRRVPIVAIDRGIETEDVPSVQLNNVAAGRMVAELFLKGGHSDVAVVMGPQNIRLARERTQGFLETLAAEGIRVPAHHRFEGPFEFQAGVEAAQRLLRQDDLPTAIWAQCDPVGAGLIREFHAAGVRVPEEVSIVGMDDTAIALMVYPRLTTVHQPLDEICRRAFGLIRTQIEADHDPAESHDPVHLRIEPSLIMRESYRDLTE
jgi:LacI family transcriptional regulator